MQGLDQVNHWSETYNELYLLFTTPGSLNGRHVTGLTEGQLQLYRDLEELQLDSGGAPAPQAVF